MLSAQPSPDTPATGGGVLDDRYARRAAVWLSMQAATLGDVPGAGLAKSRRRDQRQQEWRGTFTFRAEHEEAMAALLRDGRPVVYEGPVDGEVRRVAVTVISMVAAAGIAFFQGSGEPL